MNEDPFVEKLKKLRASGEKTEGTGGTKSEGKEIQNRKCCSYAGRKKPKNRQTFRKN